MIQKKVNIFLIAPNDLKFSYIVLKGFTHLFSRL